MGNVEGRPGFRKRNKRSDSDSSDDSDDDSTETTKPRRHRLRIKRPFSRESGAGAEKTEESDTSPAAGGDSDTAAPERVVDKAEREKRRIQIQKEVLAPIKDHEEFCKRFGVGEGQYKSSRDIFQKLAGDKDFVTDKEWSDDAPQTEAAQQWVKNIWRAFAPEDDKMTLSDWLVFDGIRKYGSLEQRVVGSFVLYDYNDDGVVEREELAAMMRTAAAVAGENVSESLIQQALEILMTEADKDHNGLLQMEDIIEAAKVQPVVAKIFNAV